MEILGECDEVFPIEKSLVTENSDSDNQDDATTKHEPEQDNDDFNEVRDETERLGTSFCIYDAKVFNDFINNSELVNLLMRGKAELGLLEDAEIEQRLLLLKNLKDLEHLKRLDIMQKAKVKWTMEEYWDAVGNFFIDMVKSFEVEVFILSGCNSSFIALIPKKSDPIDIKYFRPKSLLGCQYKVIGKVLANRLQQVGHSVISDVQTAYVQGRQIIDGPLILNEVISWATKNKERLFILKFKMEKMDESCLNSAYASVLVNGSPTKEFKICKGLRQGDPLSPFLFIVAAESLHVTIKEAKAKRLFESVKVRDNVVDLSHLQFEDDAILLGKWSLDNARNHCSILRCFNMASGLKVNFSKSKFFGIGVTCDEVSRFTSILCFQHLLFLLSTLVFQ
uniref:RNA-directed DNA polymerase, eukaryota, reverse transcriptase zinc-binding domain protein n=1 Tax=Tanacetum cinerariifolium TaxID=118510 RepID=A0A699HCR2_TANCI|nr:RNA-directed DNA polymerase, eukaryota, reverse transcriptase zinc-binding domain protein [Tanacetum cinerariifolium]